MVLKNPYSNQHLFIAIIGHSSIYPDACNKSWWDLAILLLTIQMCRVWSKTNFMSHLFSPREKINTIASFGSWTQNSLNSLLVGCFHSSWFVTNFISALDRIRWKLTKTFLVYGDSNYVSVPPHCNNQVVSVRKPNHFWQRPQRLDSFKDDAHTTVYRIQY